MSLSRLRRHGVALIAVATLSAFVVATPASGASHVPIYDIQGEGHVSPHAGQTVTTTGVVTAIGFNTFWVQDPHGDGNDATSDALTIFDTRGSTFAAIDVGTCVELTDRIDERIPGGAATGNLSTTQMAFPGITVIEDCDWQVPDPVIVGLNGRIAPNEVVISDDELPVNLQFEAGEFDPDEDAIDFYESLENMLVEVEKPRAVSAIRQFGTFSAEVFTVPNNGNPEIVEPNNLFTKNKGGIFLQPHPQNLGDQNPERLQIQFNGAPLYQGNIFDLPAIKVGDRLNDVTGVIGYSFGNFELNAINEVVVEKPSNRSPESSTLAPDANHLTVATYNVLNLSADGSDTVQAALLGEQITHNLNAPDVIALQEIQDNNGTTDDGTTAADQTLELLVDAIAAAGGPDYAAFDIAPDDNTQGGAPGGNIRTAFLYNRDRVELIDFESLNPAVLTAAGADPAAFAGTRFPLAGTFSFNGNEFTVVSVHNSSRFGSTPIFGGPQPFVQAGEAEREAQSKALNAYVDHLLAEDPGARVMVAGDFNTFQWTDELLEDVPGPEPVLVNLLSTDFVGTDLYTFNFEGNSQALDSFFVTHNLVPGSGFDVVHVNVDFPRRFVDTVGSDHEPLLARFEMTPVKPAKTFDLQVLHASDLEGGVDALDRAPNFAAIVDALEDNPAVDASIKLSAGDNYIPGPFFSASGDRGAFRDSGLFNDVYNEHFGVTSYDSLREGGGRVDATIMNVIGFDASAVGNHEFDLGSDTFESIIEEEYRSPAGPGGDRWVGTQFPYLSANLDFSGDGDLGNLFTSSIQSNLLFETGPAESGGNQTDVPKLAPATVIYVGAGERIGVVGATTPLLQQISSPTGTTVTPTTNDMAALAAVLQPVIDEMEAMGINKIVMVSHLQQIALEQELVALLDGVDISIAGGSDTLLANADDALRTGDVAAEQYPVITSDAAGDPVVVVSTDGEYSYVGQLNVRFNAAGQLVASSGPASPLTSLSQLDLSVNGPVKTEAAEVDAAWGGGDPFATGTKGELVQRLVDAIVDVVIAKDSLFVGETSVFIEGRREFVRTEETNGGNLTSDANLWMAQQYDPATVASIKNGGGIRAEIGEIDNSGGTTVFLPPQDNPLVPGDDTGLVSQLDLENTLRFNNELTLLTLTAAELQAVIEHAVAASGPGSTPGQFAQVAGLQFSYDVSQAPGSRVQSLVVDPGGAADTVVSGGVLQGDPNRTFRIVTLNFLAGGGDGYPFPATDRVDLGGQPDPLAGGAFTFASPGSEQDALAEYMDTFHGVGDGTPFSDAETPPAADTRIVAL